LTQKESKECHFGWIDMNDSAEELGDIARMCLLTTPNQYKFDSTTKSFIQQRQRDSSQVLYFTGISDDDYEDTKYPTQKAYEEALGSFSMERGFSRSFNIDNSATYELFVQMVHDMAILGEVCNFEVGVTSIERRRKGWNIRVYRVSASIPFTLFSKPDDGTKEVRLVILPWRFPCKIYGSRPCWKDNQKQWSVVKSLLKYAHSVEHVLNRIKKRFQKTFYQKRGISPD